MIAPPIRPIAGNHRGLFVLNNLFFSCEHFSQIQSAFSSGLGILLSMLGPSFSIHAVLSFLILILVGPISCQQQSQPGFELVEPGMSREQVRGILGSPSSTYDREVDVGGDLLRSERWQYGDNLSTLATGVFFSDMPSESVWSVYFDEEGRVLRVQEPQRIESREQLEFPSRFDDPADPAIPSRSR